MSNQQLAEREAARATQTKESGQRSTAADRSEDHLIRGYD